jgi:hypothetical protein
MAEKIEFYFHHIFDLKGSFSFEADGFTISSFFRRTRYVSYAEVAGISRLYYERARSVVNVVISEASPNKYRIALRDGCSIEFLVARREENAYRRSMERLRRKIYGGNRLGVHLRIKNADAKTLRERDKQFKREAPPRDYSLEKAITALLIHCGMELDDQTQYESPQKEKARKNFPPARDENTFVALAELISGGDKEVVSEVSSTAERREGYAEKNEQLRGLEEHTLTSDDARWMAMIDTLKKHGYAEEVRYDEPRGQIERSLNRIKNRLNVKLNTLPALDMLSAGEELDTVKTARLLNLIALTLDGQRWTLCSLDVEGDTYILCLLPHKTFGECEKLLEGTEFSISPY